MKKLSHIIGGFAIVIIIWQLIFEFGHYNQALFPSPQGVIKGFEELLMQGVLLDDIYDSMIRFLIGYSISVVLGITLGLILGWFRGIWGFINPIVQVLRPISPMAWLPFIVLWFGIGDIPAMVIIFIAAFFPILLATVSAVSNVDQTYLKIAKNFGIKQPQILTKIILPATFPNIATGLHLALGTAWVFLVAGEMVGAQTGLGFLIIDARNNLRADMLMAAMIVIGVMGLLLDSLICLLEKWIYKRWGIVANERSAA
jgi:NitT/TauT family transport system permease protein